MLGLNKIQIAVLAGAALLGVLIFLAPHLDGEVQPEVVISDADRKVDSAIALVQGPNPMAGIMLLRQVLEEDPRNVRAQFQMGIFSMQSQQFEKAIQRFETVLEIDPQVYEALLLAGHAYARTGNSEQALTKFEAYKSHLTSPKDIEEVDGYINELKTQ